jgi:NAD(P)-dependent dehydrogenase (short-subunit alcohol dehydrogenase family)
MSCCADPGCRCNRFAGKVALITGAASGIGRAAALQMANEKARLSICDCNAEGLDETRRLAEAAGAECMSTKVDVRSQDEVEACVQATLATYGSVDILVNNAGTGQFAPFAMMSNEEYDRVMDINVRGVFFFARAVLPGMMDKDYGKIINVSSIVSLSGAQGQSIYSASKGAVKMMTQSVALDVAGYHINVNAVAPGMVLTGLTHNMLGDPDQAQTFIDRIAMRRIGKPEDIAAAICFLASDEASYVHGTTLVVDGGMLAGNLL